MKKLWLGSILLLVVFIISACGNQASESNPEEMNETGTSSDSGEEMHEGHEGMEMHTDSGEVPDGLETAENPTYEVGSEVIIEADHMKGMDGAEATIAGAYNTTAYTVSYTPSDGGEQVTNHKWVIHEEITEPDEEPLEPGTEVTLDATHMEGMDGVTAVIDSAEETTVYMVDLISTETGEKMTNHKWVTESEITAD